MQRDLPTWAGRAQIFHFILSAAVMRAKE